MRATAIGPNIDTLRAQAHEITGSRADYDPLLEAIGDASFVLLGEATHGTHEFYRARAEITKRLILEKQFTALAWEADWPDALRISRYIQGRGADQSALEAVGDFKRFPSWMWRNADVLDLVGWLRAHNERRGRGEPPVGVYGLDLYSLHSSLQAVIRYLEKLDPELAANARRRYSCFEAFGEDAETYGMSAADDRSRSCEEQVVQQLLELQRRSTELLSRDGQVAADELFYARQNAEVAREAEHYYRAMYRGRTNTWNLRDTHMVDTLDRLVEHLRGRVKTPKVVIWAHNSHLGDARYTSMHQRGEINVGQLVRERHGGQTFNVGFTTFEGTVTAASDWGGRAERKRVRPALAESWEHAFHEMRLPRFLLLTRPRETADELSFDLLERAIGVLYLPETERWSHYFYARPGRQFDALIHFDETRAVEPLERSAEWERGDLPETFPSAM